MASQRPKHRIIEAIYILSEPDALPVAARLKRSNHTDLREKIIERRSRDTDVGVVERLCLIEQPQQTVIANCGLIHQSAGDGIGVCKREDPKPVIAGLREPGKARASDVPVGRQSCGLAVVGITEAARQGALRTLKIINADEELVLGK